MSVEFTLAGLAQAGLAGLVSMAGADAGGGAPQAAPVAAEAAAAPARDGDVAIREEFDAAVARGTREAFGLFIERHPDHPLAGEARRRLTNLR